MDEKRYQALKNQADLILHELDTIGNSGNIHKGDALHYRISYRLQRLNEKGEAILVGKHDTVFYTLDGLEAKLVEAREFITKEKKQQ